MTLTGLLRHFWVKRTVPLTLPLTPETRSARYDMDGPAQPDLHDGELLKKLQKNVGLASTLETMTAARSRDSLDFIVVLVCVRACVSPVMYYLRMWSADEDDDGPLLPSFMPALPRSTQRYDVHSSQLAGVCDESEQLPIKSDHRRPIRVANGLLRFVGLTALLSYCEGLE